MKLTGVHLLLTYGCTSECDHCFVWSSPRQPGTMTLGGVEEVLRQARDLRTAEWFYFEGGEPFLYHGLLRWGVRRAAELGFRVGVVSNAYWATSEGDALEWLRDLAGSIQDLSLSCDPYHGDREQERRVRHARAAAGRLGIPTDTIAIADVSEEAPGARGQIPAGASRIMFRGRAAVRLADRAPKASWNTFDSCPYENLRDPGRVHVDPLGYVHVCQGITIGNVFSTTLAEICRDYDPDAHPITGPLLGGGPARLAEEHGVQHEAAYSDACHLCYRTREALRPRLHDVLGPDQMYGEVPAAEPA